MKHLGLALFALAPLACIVGCQAGSNGQDVGQAVGANESEVTEATIKSQTLFVGALHVDDEVDNIAYSVPALYRGLKLEPVEADTDVDLDVDTAQGNVAAWIVDADFHVVVSETRRQPRAALSLRVPAHAAYSVIFREYDRQPTAINVHSKQKGGATPPSTGKDCHEDNGSNAGLLATVKHGEHCQFATGYGPLSHPFAICDDGFCGAGCFIDSKYVPVNGSNPANACEICTPYDDQRDFQWSTVAEGYELYFPACKLCFNPTNGKRDVSDGSACTHYDPETQESSNGTCHAGKCE